MTGRCRLNRRQHRGLGDEYNVGYMELRVRQRSILGLIVAILVEQ